MLVELSYVVLKSNVDVPKPLCITAPVSFKDESFNVVSAVRCNVPVLEYALPALPTALTEYSMITAVTSTAPNDTISVTPLFEVNATQFFVIASNNEFAEPVNSTE